MVQGLGLGGANLGQSLGAHGGAVGVNRRDRRGQFHLHRERGEQQARDEETDADVPDGAFSGSLSRPPVVGAAPEISSGVP